MAVVASTISPIGSAGSPHLTAVRPLHELSEEMATTSEQGRTELARFLKRLGESIDSGLFLTNLHAILLSGDRGDWHGCGV